MIFGSRRQGAVPVNTCTPMHPLNFRVVWIDGSVTIVTIARTSLRAKAAIKGPHPQRFATLHDYSLSTAMHAELLFIAQRWDAKVTEL